MHYLTYLFTKEPINEVWDVEPYMAPFRDAAGYDLADMRGVPLEFVQEEHLSVECESDYEECSVYNRLTKSGSTCYSNKNGLWDWYTVGGRWNHCINAKAGKELFKPTRWQTDLILQYDSTGRFDTCKVDDLVNDVHHAAYEYIMKYSSLWESNDLTSEEIERRKKIQALWYASNWSYYVITSDFRLIDNHIDNRYELTEQESKGLIQKFWDDIIVPEMGNYVTVIDVHN